tara:strand:- start:64 stop:513 length:450 start_codon:yes stop_codon:yes gene_type:complete
MKEFVMRGQTASGRTEILNFSGFKPGLAYRMTEFSLYPGTNVGGTTFDLVGTVTASKTAEQPTDPNFNNEGLIASGMFFTKDAASSAGGSTEKVVVNDTFLITQNLILFVQDTGGSASPVNWQCRFEPVKMSGAEEAVTNYKQFLISDE